MVVNGIWLTAHAPQAGHGGHGVGQAVHTRHVGGGGHCGHCGHFGHFGHFTHAGHAGHLPGSSIFGTNLRGTVGVTSGGRVGSGYAGGRLRGAENSTSSPARSGIRKLSTNMSL